MGALTSRQNAGVEEIDIGTNHAYRYPPKSGNYFGNHFIMGGERFDTPQPEAYLFGENVDLNFLGSRPAPFPYPAPQPNEPIKTLKSYVNIRKESVRFVRVTEEDSTSEDRSNMQYNIEFTFDSDVRCTITIHYFCTEEITQNGVIYTSKDPSMSSEPYHYKRGANQQFTQVSHVFDPSNYTEEELNYNLDKEISPIVIQCIAEQGDEPRQQHIILAIVEKNSDGSYGLKALKQKQFVDGLCYLLQELYGIENKNADMTKHLNEDEVEDNGSECVICMCDMRDTLILPCRHLCLCNNCADSLRYQANNCPICRAPFRALLQIRALRKMLPGGGGMGDSQPQDNVPHGYEYTSLLEALNGPPTRPLPVMPPIPTLRSVPPLHVVAQDAVTSPSLPNAVESFHRRACSASSGSLRCLPMTEDSSAQTDSQVIPLENMTEVAVLLSDQGVEETSTNEEPPPRRQSRDVLLIQPSDVLHIINEKSQHAPEVLEMNSIPCTGDDSLAHTAPDSLHLSESRREINSRHPDTSPVGEESDYYTPEDPNTTILSGGCIHHPLSPLSEVQAVTDFGISSGSRDSEDEMVTDLDENSHLPPVKPLSRALLMEVAGSTPGTPQSQTSNRSSGDSFSSSTSTRFLLSTGGSPEYSIPNPKV